MALAGLLGDKAYGANSEGSTQHFSPRAKNVIFCFMDGGPSHVDTFDPKPSLKKYEGKKIGADAVSNRSQSNANRLWLGSPWEFKQQIETDPYF